MSRRILQFALLCLGALGLHAAEPAQPFGADFPTLDSLAVGEWWNKRPAGKPPPPSLNVPRNEVVAFAVYTHDRGVLKLRRSCSRCGRVRPGRRGWSFAKAGSGGRRRRPPCCSRAGARISAITVAADENDGRKPVGWLPELVIKGAKNAVVQVVEEGSGDILYTVRTSGDRFRPRVYRAGNYTVKVGRDRPDGKELKRLTPKPEGDAGKIEIAL